MSVAELVEIAGAEARRVIDSLEGARLVVPAEGGVTLAHEALAVALAEARVVDRRGAGRAAARRGDRARRVAMEARSGERRALEGAQARLREGDRPEKLGAFVRGGARARAREPARGEAGQGARGGGGDGVRARGDRRGCALRARRTRREGDRAGQTHARERGPQEGRGQRSREGHHLAAARRREDPHGGQRRPHQAAPRQDQPDERRGASPS